MGTSSWNPLSCDGHSVRRTTGEGNVKSFLGPRGRRIAVAAVAIFAVIGGIAYAAIPDAGTGTYHACMLKSIGTIRIIDPSKQSCNATYETEITFNQKGSKGDPGGPGAQGAAGANGSSPTVTQVAAGHPQCPAGGAAITDAAGTTAYVCSGANGEDGADGEPFSGTFTSPNGAYTISVSDTGISLESPGAAVHVGGTAIDVQTSGALNVAAGTTIGLSSDSGTALSSGSSFSVDAGSSFTVDAGGSFALAAGNSFAVDAGSSFALQTGTSFALAAGSTATLQSGAGFSLAGSVVNINRGTTCERAARVGDSVDPVRDVILTGAANVCIG